MTDPEKPKNRRRATPKGPDSKPANALKPGSKSLSPRLWFAARALYESHPKITYADVGKEFGVSRSVVERRSREERWKKRPAETPEQRENLTDMAHRIADKAGGALEEYGPEIGADDKDKEKAREEVTDEAGAEVRAQIISRHRAEWNAPRKLSYEAVKEKNFDRAKLAKITSETLKLIQDGERKAWGFDNKEGDSNVTIVIERG